MLLKTLHTSFDFDKSKSHTWDHRPLNGQNYLFKRKAQFGDLLS